MYFRKFSAFACFVFVIQSVDAAESQTGPVIKDFERVFDVSEGSWNLRKGKNYKVSMDVSARAELDGELNRHFESAARFNEPNPAVTVALSAMTCMSACSQRVIP